MVGEGEGGEEGEDGTSRKTPRKVVVRPRRKVRKLEEDEIKRTERSVWEPWGENGKTNR